MIINPFDTTVCRGYSVFLAELQSALAKAEASGEIGMDDRLTDGVKTSVVFVTALRHPTVTIKPFAHPVLYKNVYGEERIAIDVRSMVTSRDTLNEAVTVKARSEFAALLARAILQRCWSAGHYADIRNISILPLQLFQRWVSEVISRQFNLAPEVQAKMACLAAHYYICLFRQDLDGDFNRSMHESTISRATNIGTGFVKEALDGVGYIGNLKEFADVVVARNWSVRLNTFASALAIQMLAGSWIGQHTREMVAVGLEHPPTFSVLVYDAINDRGGRKTRLGDILHKAFDKGDNFKDYSKNFVRCLELWRS